MNELFNIYLDFHKQILADAIEFYPVKNINNIMHHIHRCNLPQNIINDLCKEYDKPTLLKNIQILKSELSHLTAFYLLQDGYSLHNVHNIIILLDESRPEIIKQFLIL